MPFLDLFFFVSRPVKSSSAWYQTGYLKLNSSGRNLIEKKLLI